MSNLIESAQDLGLRTSVAVKRRLMDDADRGATYVVEIIACIALVIAIIAGIQGAAIGTALQTAFTTAIAALGGGAAADG